MTTLDILKSKHKQLSQEEVEIFMKEGCLVVHNVFPQEIADKVISLVCAELKLDMKDPSTWPKHLVALQKVLQKKGNKLQLPSDWPKFTPLMILKKNLEADLVSEIYTQRYCETIDDLCGAGRWKMRRELGHWPILFPFFRDHLWQPLEGGWHLDGDFERMSITSANIGLILMHLFTDIHFGGGGTAVRIGSHHYTARILAEAGPDGLEREELIPHVITATQHLPVRELTGNNGDLLIMHPWVVHSSSLNTSEHFRIAANKHIALYSPMNFMRNKRSDYSLAELTVVDSIVGQGFNLPLGTNESNGTSEKPAKQEQHALRSVVERINRLRYINAKDILRIIALRSNPYWPFSILNKKSYELAIKAFAKLCTNYPEIKSVYLRHPLTEGNWTPALSDIDLTVISQKDISSEQEFDFLNLFWKKFHQLKKLFPMYGEIYLIRETDFELWHKLEFEGSNTQNWVLINGTSIIKNSNGIGNSQFKSEAFNQAFSFYLNHFLDLFNRKGFSSHLIFLDLLRVKNKILKCLQRSQSLQQPANIPPYSSSISSTELLCNVVEELKEGLANSTLLSAKIDVVWRKEAETKNNLLVDNEAVDMTRLSAWHDKIQCVYLNFTKKLFIILKDGLDQHTFANCIKAVAGAFSNEKRLPVILNVNLFRYFLCQYKPFEYGHFMCYRTLAFGTDILPDIAPPDKSAIANQLIKETAEILKFPFSRKFFVSSRKWDSVPEFVHIFDIALMTKHYLEHGIISPWYQEFLDSSYKAYPNHVKKLEELKRSKMPHIELFIYYKQLAKEIHGIITSNKLSLIANENHI